MAGSSRIVVLLYLLALLTFIVSGQEGKDSEPFSGQELELFLIPHSHCDAGWLISFEQYYESEVQHILTSVVEELALDTTGKRVFNWAEIGFFNRWWQDQDDETRSKVKDLISARRWEFIGGGWVQNDEAVTSYEAIINQCELGHQWLASEFGVGPSIAWQIDPFGPSGANTHLFTMMGYKGLVHDRIGYAAKVDYERTHHMEFHWNTSEAGGSYRTDGLPVHILDNILYSFPPTFDFELEDGNPPITDKNGLKRAAQFVSIARVRAKEYRTSKILVPIGNDFRYQNATKQFENYDKLIKIINENQHLFNVTVHYSTLSQYFESLSELSTSWPVKNSLGDYYPYAQVPDAWWSGFYSSRPTLKQRIREADSALQAAEQVSTALRFTVNNNGKDSRVQQLLYNNRQISGILTHHDAVSGTAAQDVVHDYKELAEKSIAQSAAIITTMFASDSSATISVDDLSQTNILKGGNVTIMVYNSLGHSRRSNVNIPATKCMSVRETPSMRVLTSQLVPTEGEDAFRYRLHWMGRINALGTTTYLITPDSSAGCSYSSELVYSDISPANPMDQSPILQNANLQLYFNNTGYLTDIIDRAAGESMKVTNEVLLYTGDRDGAYIFRPKSVRSIGAVKTVKIVNGSIVSQITLTFRSDFLVKQTFRLINAVDKYDMSSPYQAAAGAAAHVFLYTDTLPEGGELVSRFRSSTIGGNLHTNMNGLFDVERQRLQSPGTSGDDDISYIAQEFFPTTHAASLYSSSSPYSLSVIFNRAHAVASLEDGQVEAIVQRRTATNDFPPAGLGEALDDQDDVQDVTLLVASASGAAPGQVLRTTLTQILNNPLVVLPLADSSRVKYDSFLSNDLPDNLRLLTLKTSLEDKSKTILRLHHLYPPTATAPVSYTNDSCVSLADMFAFGKIRSATQYSLSLLYNQGSVDVSKKVCIAQGDILTLLVSIDYY